MQTGSSPDLPSPQMSPLDPLLEAGPHSEHLLCATHPGSYSQRNPGGWYSFSHLEGERTGSERSSVLPGWLVSGSPGVRGPNIPLPVTLSPGLPALGDTCPGCSARCLCTWALSGS